MAWTSVVIEIDADKVGAGKAEAAQATAVFDYGNGKVFTYTERIDSGSKAGFAARAHAAKLSNDTKVNRETNAQATLLTQLQALDP